jgi:hydroxyacylglutathione hydrolase
LSELQIHQFTCREDNFGVLLHHEPTRQTISIDAPDAGTIERVLVAHGWDLTHILLTHHHADHVEGVAALKTQSGCKVIGPNNPAIANIDEFVAEGDTLELAGDQVKVIATPGHTLDMLNFHFTRAGVVFTGDTLFAMGCGRVFEGTPAQMWESLRKLMALPKETQVYCGHEYTLANARFSLTIDPQNPALQARAKEVEALRAQGKPTLPTTIALELATNPFLRAADPAIRKHLGMENATDAEVFTEIRERKNRG